MKYLGRHIGNIVNSAGLDHVTTTFPLPMLAFYAVPRLSIATGLNIGIRLRWMNRLTKYGKPKLVAEVCGNFFMGYLNNDILHL